MNELIIKQDNLAVIDPTVAERIAEYTMAIDVAKEQLDNIKNLLKDEMERKGIIKLEAETDDGTVSINYVAPTTSERFNSRKFRKEHPDMYDDYVDISSREGYLKLSVN